MKTIGKRTWRLLTGMSGTAILLALAACASPAPPQATARPAAPAQPPAKAEAPAQPAAKPEAPAKPAWQVEWEKTVAAARQEGKLVMTGHPGDAWRKAQMTFEQDYPGIPIEYTGTNAREFWPRIYKEKEAGLHLWDVRVGGVSVSTFQARDDGIIDPLRPLLLLPEVADESKWFGGFKGMFADKELQYSPGFLGYVSYMFQVNRDSVAQAELNDVEQLLEPKWRGKISMHDPRGGGPAESFLITSLFLYGEDFVRDLLTKQDITLTNDRRQQVEWIVRGRYPVGIGVSDGELVSFQQQGVGLNVKDVRSKRGGSLSSGAGGVQYMKNAPHPNAAKVFINWLLSRDVQERISKSVERNSRRVDVPPAQPENVPDASKEYFIEEKEEAMPIINRTNDIVKESLK